MWNLAPPPGFQGLDPHKPLTVYYRFLPHWRQDGATYFVTFRQQDSLPRLKLDELRLLKREWQRKNPAPHSRAGWEEWARIAMLRIETWLDQGNGSCRLHDQRAAKLVVEAMHHFDSQRYELDCYALMPNHVHAILRPLAPAVHPLEKILQSWKLYTSRRINALFGTPGHLWQPESFDRIIRDEEHLYRAVRYIGANPEKAGLPAADKVWIRPQWQALGWDFEGSVV